MAHLLVEQLRFTRSELMRCVAGVSETDGMHRFGQMNSINWIIGHLANHENRSWVYLGQEKLIFPELNNIAGFGSSGAAPPLKEMLEIWGEVTSTADEYLDQLKSTTLENKFTIKGKLFHENIGTMLFRNIYHYWFHIGEVHSIRQQLGQKDLPDFVGNMKQYNYSVQGND